MPVASRPALPVASGGPRPVAAHLARCSLTPASALVRLGHT